MAPPARRKTLSPSGGGPGVPISTRTLPTASPKSVPMPRPCFSFGVAQLGPNRLWHLRMPRTDRMPWDNGDCSPGAHSVSLVPGVHPVNTRPVTKSRRVHGADGKVGRVGVGTSAPAEAGGDISRQMRRPCHSTCTFLPPLPAPVSTSPA